MIIYKGYRIFNFETINDIAEYLALKIVFKYIDGTWHHVNTFRSLTEALNYCKED